MASWRDNASPQAQDDLEGLLEPALDFAQQQLGKYGQFFPYSVVVRSDGQTEMVAVQPDAANDQPASTDVVDACRTTLAERRDRLRAAAVIADVRLPDGGDAIRVELEHIEGLALTIFLPYSQKRFGHSFRYGQLQAAAGTRRIWF